MATKWTGSFLGWMVLLFSVLIWSIPSTGLAGFASTEVFLPAVGRVPGQGGAQFYTTVWATNLTSAPQTFTFELLKQGQANTTPASFTDTLQPGQTKVYENVVESKLGLASAIGAARITSTGEVLMAERIYDQAPGADIGATVGLFFAGVPRSFSISAGQSASIQGINQGSTENFRYNFALVETGGGSPTVNVQIFDGSGTLLGQKSYPLKPYEQLQPGVGDIVPNISTINARITATVTGGTGSVLLAGAQLANESQDSSGFEMTFRDSLLGGTSTGGGLTAVAHNTTLTGDGTPSSPLGVDPAGVVTSLNGVHGGVTLSGGSNVTITPSGQTITIASTGDGGGLTLPFNGTTSSGSSAFQVSNTGAGDALHGEAGDSNHAGVAGINSGAGQGVYGQSSTGDGIQGNSSSAYGVRGSSTNNWGIYGFSSKYTGVVGETANPSIGAYGVLSMGNFGATGTKDFVEPHPTDPSKEIRYVSLEGRESGTYFRGTGRISGGFATIEVPDDFRMVTSPDGLTVVTTPEGDLAVLACVRKDLNQIVIKGSSDVPFDYIVNGVRKAFEGFAPVSENKDFIPRSASDSHFGSSLPAESLRRLKASGILNPDGTINLETAHRLGWDQMESWKRAEAAKQ